MDIITNTQRHVCKVTLQKKMLPQVHNRRTSLQNGENVLYSTQGGPKKIPAYRVVQKADTRFIFAITSVNEHRF